MWRVARRAASFVGASCFFTRPLSRVLPQQRSLSSNLSLRGTVNIVPRCSHVLKKTSLLGVGLATAALFVHSAQSAALEPENKRSDAEVAKAVFAIIRELEGRRINIIEADIICKHFTCDEMVILFLDIVLDELLTVDKALELQEGKVFKKLRNLSIASSLYWNSIFLSMSREHHRYYKMAEENYKDNYKLMLKEFEKYNQLFEKYIPIFHILSQDYREITRQKLSAALEKFSFLEKYNSSKYFSQPYFYALQILCGELAPREGKSGLGSSPTKSK